MKIIAPPPRPRSRREFDPDRLAELEARMWQAYYRKERVRLFLGLVVLLHEHNYYPWPRALLVAFHLARAASLFSNTNERYECILPHLEKAYAMERDCLQAGFDPAAVARAELAWWIARREPSQNTRQVGLLIAEEHALFYEVSRDRVIEAAMLRAHAAHLRDEGGDNADWARVEDVLGQSYRSLRAALEGER